MTPKWKLVFRLNEILILVIRGEKKNIWFLRFSFGVIWKCAFRLNETLIFDIRMSKKNGKKSVFFWSLYNVNNLRTASFSLNATRCRSKSLNSACFHTWRCVSTYRSTPIWTSLDSLLTAISVEGSEVATFSSDAKSNPVVGFRQWSFCRLFPKDFWRCTASWRYSFGGSPGPLWTFCSQSLFCNWLEIHEHHLHIPRIPLAPTSTSWPGPLLAWILAEVELSWQKRHSGLRQFNLNSFSVWEHKKYFVFGKVRWDQFHWERFQQKPPSCATCHTKKTHMSLEILRSCRAWMQSIPEFDLSLPVFRASADLAYGNTLF